MKNNINSELVSIIPVRSGSKGLPKKNMLKLLNKPLYLHAVHQGLNHSDRVIISTDIIDIKNQELPSNCSICWRPNSLAKDNTPMSDVISHVIKKNSLDGCNILILQATSPLRNGDDIEKCKNLFSSGKYNLVMSVARQNNSVFKFGFMEKNIFKPINDPKLCFYNRQELPNIYGPNGAVYIMNANEFMNKRSFPTDKIGAYEMPYSRSHDIDTMQDFIVVKKLFSENLNKKK